MKKILLLIMTFVGLHSYSFSFSCSPGFDEVIIRIVPDAFPQEISWNFADNSGNIIASGTSSGDTLCVVSGSCNIFSIFDTYGDGIIGAGGYWLYINGVLISTGNRYGHGTTVSANCSPGSFCTNPDTLTYGSHTTTFEDNWYVFVAPATGSYKISTCSLNSCNTQIWIYTSCPSIPYDEGAPGTYAYNDDFCGNEAEVTFMMIANSTYLIRIGDSVNDCTGPVLFDFNYVGPVQGCMDPTACNFNPLAVIDDGSCIYYPAPGCQGPDLKFDSLTFVNSLSLSNTNASNCDIAEGCLLNYGARSVIRFTSKILNVGTLDYYIGNPANQPGMFNTQNCHGHSHYEGYGDYRLIDMNNNVIPAGHKNGFCVLDLCGSGQYSCGNMGISVGCYDSYGSGTSCQWVDITDVPEGDYRLAVIVNSQHLPDALGRHEMNYINNATQVCIHISRNASNIPSFTLLPNCTPFVDCDGVPGGSAVTDCNNVCNGPGVFGDTYNDAQLDSNDITTYLDLISSEMPATSCFDLSGDSLLSVYDAALANWCLHTSSNGSHSHCRFPRNVTNSSDSMGLSIKNIDYVNNYIDIEIKNPSSKLKAYQFSLTGVTPISAVSLVDPTVFPVDIRLINNSNEIFALSPVDSSYERSIGTAGQDLVRVYFSSFTDTLVCINVKEIINEFAERTNAYVYGSCFASVPTTINTFFRNAELTIIPNPASEKAFIHIAGQTSSPDVKVFDVNGREYNPTWNVLRDDWYEVDLHSLPDGVYIIHLDGEVFGTARLVKIGEIH